MVAEPLAPGPKIAVLAAKESAKKAYEQQGLIDEDFNVLAVYAEHLEDLNPGD